MKPRDDSEPGRRRFPPGVCGLNRTSRDLPPSVSFTSSASTAQSSRRIAACGTVHHVATMIAPHMGPGIVYGLASAQFVAHLTGTTIGIVAALFYAGVASDLGNVPRVGMVPTAGRTLSSLLPGVLDRGLSDCITHLHHRIGVLPGSLGCPGLPLAIHLQTGQHGR